MRLKQKVTLCVRSPNTAHTRRPARRITCPSVPLAARGSGPAAAEYAASRRKPCPLRVHARRYPLVEAPATALQRLAGAVEPQAALRGRTLRVQKIKITDTNPTPNTSAEKTQTKAERHSTAWPPLSLSSENGTTLIQRPACSMPYPVIMLTHSGNRHARKPVMPVANSVRPDAKSFAHFACPKP